MNPQEYRAQQEWLRLHGSDFPQRAAMIRRQLKRYEREHGPVGDAPVVSSRWVAYFPDRPGQPLGSKSVHADPQCLHLSDAADVGGIREATADEVARLRLCGTCGA